MEHKIIKHIKNPFLHRDELTYHITADKNPSFEDIRHATGKDHSLVVIKGVKGNFGGNSFNAEVIVYDSAENKNKVEKISRKQRRKNIEEAKKATQPAA